MSTQLSAFLDGNRTHLQTRFEQCADVVFRECQAAGHRALLIYIEGLVNPQDLHEHLPEPILGAPQGVLTGTVDAVVEGLLAGHVALLLDGMDSATLVPGPAGARRAVEEPSAEAVVRGPREGFTEEIRVNTGLVRRRIHSADLKLRQFTIGKRTRTAVALAYLQGVAEPAVVEEVASRLRGIEIDSVLESGYIEELIEETPFSPFPEYQYSERPDTIAAQLLEGRVAIFVDGTPIVLTAPINFWQMLHASEDYYERFFHASLLRMLRFLFIFLALFMPALYIATTTFHQDMLPTSLLLSIAAAREPIPFPALVEALMMEVTFEALREAGLRLPKPMGQTISILGALVIGQAAVQAGIVSAPMVIIVSITGIASFTVPKYNTAIAIRMLRFPLMVLAGAFGLFGVVLGTVWIGLHLCHLRSVGVPYLTGLAPIRPGMWKDMFLRVPWWRMRSRPGAYTRDGRRLGENQKPAPPNTGR